ncbi:uncharacterized protein ELE39_002313 [Cryptosporidium sp. chipmunk genotype I]|uniref:uncharacterized protein n=1 Tax=Cryptosporidium sp. chipmunk genotype I TaxID=1280935 RepID=UPI00351A5183|nr:hypothetical protein ELE39_002313 [Cryptosporidium sp. chipmunk genotype I]
MDKEFLVLLVVTIFMSLKVSSYRCDDKVVKDVKPIISELFDMLLENIETKKKKERHLNEMFFNQEKELNYSLEDNEPKKLIANRKAINEATQDRIEILDREISILDGQMNLRLGIVVSLFYGNHSVLVFKQWNENYSNISENYGLLCSSSNINSSFITNLSKFKEIKNINKNFLVFEMNQEISNLNEKTFLICLSDSITSNHSIYITKLSFSSYNEPKGADHHEEENLIQHEDSKSKSELIGYNEILELNQQENEDQILVRTIMPSGQKCSDFNLILLSNHKNPLKNGDLLSETKISNSESICFWRLKLENTQFENSDLLEVVQRHKNSGATFPVSVVKLLPLSHRNGKRRKLMLSKSFLFKILLVILNLIPITLLTLGLYLILAEFWTNILSKVLENKKYLTNPLSKSSRYHQRANNVSKETISNRENERNTNWIDKRKVTKPAQISSFNIITSQNLNSEESGFSSGENEPVVKDDPFRYFDSDCSISTHTGI